MKPLYLLIALFSFCSSAAQTDTAYFDSYYRKTNDPAVASSYSVIQKGPDTLWSVHRYSVHSGKLEMEGHYIGLDSPTRKGEVIYYDTLGSISRKGSLVNDKKHGEWSDYYFGGKQLHYREYYEHGEARNFYGYYESGKLKREVIYEGSKVITKRKFAEDGSELSYTPHEVMPEADYNVNNYLAKNIVYPKKCIRQNISGRVIVKFVIDENGKIGTVIIMKSVHPLIDEEAMRVVRSMPDWKPGLSDDKPVKVYYSLPIKFSLGENEREPDMRIQK